jgi:hypothetical protein
VRVNRIKGSSSKSKFNWRKLKGMGSLGALGFLMLFQYQNCAPAMQTVDMAKVSEEGLPVSTIDDVSGSTGVTFIQDKVQLVTNDQPTVLEGSCDTRQEGAILGWRVHDGDDNELERGYAVCEQGRFEVEMVPASVLECDKSYHLTAKLGVGSAGHLELERNCGQASL